MVVCLPRSKTDPVTSFELKEGSEGESPGVRSGRPVLRDGVEGPPRRHLERHTTESEDLKSLSRLGYSSRGCRRGRATFMENKSATTPFPTLRLGLKLQCRYVAKIVNFKLETPSSFNTVEILRERTRNFVDTFCL